MNNIITALTFIFFLFTFISCKKDSDPKTQLEITVMYFGTSTIKEGVKVELYNNYNDWLNSTNRIGPIQYTDNNGKVLYTDSNILPKTPIGAGIYYIRAYDGGGKTNAASNYTTQQLKPHIKNTFTTYLQ